MEADHQRGPFPGLILEWRQLPSREWQARVVYIPDLNRGESVQRWFAGRATPPGRRPLSMRTAQGVHPWAVA